MSVPSSSSLSACPGSSSSSGVSPHSQQAAAIVQNCIAQLMAAHNNETLPIPPTLPLALEAIVQGQVSDVLSAAFMVALAPLRCSPALVQQCVAVLQRHVLPISLKDVVIPPLLDIVGTGGDGLHTFNASTCAALLCGACGAAVAKHGNRSASGSVGAADMLEAAGAQLTMSQESIHKFLTAKQGFVFLFAQQFHPNFRHLSQVRKQLSVKTLFNLLGPFLNPLPITYQLTGISSAALAPLFLSTFRSLGITRCWVVHSHDGMDEVSPCAPTDVWYFDKNHNTEGHMTITPQDFGLPVWTILDVKSGTAEQNAAHMRQMFTAGSAESPQLHYTFLQAAAALTLTGIATDFKHGVKLCRDAIASGAALKTLDDYIALSHLHSSTPPSSPAPTISPKPQSMLHTIAAHRRNLIAQKMISHPIQDLLIQSLNGEVPTLINVLQRIQPYASSPGFSHAKIAVMAEIKRASPSAGDIQQDLNAVEQALLYAHGGASVISVLTEPKWFKGTIEDLRAVRAALENVPNRPAILLKDFVESEYQILEARCAGADTLLLIVALLPPQRLMQLILFSRQLNMEPLVEVANEEEMKVALDMNCKLVGINNRNLHNFTVNMDMTHRCMQIVQSHPGAHPYVAALSGIKTRADVSAFENAGVAAVLVGETLVRSNDPAQTIRELMGVDTASVQMHPNNNTLVKICGICNLSAALAAHESHVDLLGLIFVPGSRRHVALNIAREIVQHFKARCRYDPPSCSDSITNSPAPAYSSLKLPTAAQLFSSSHSTVDPPPSSTSGQTSEWFRNGEKIIRHMHNNVRGCRPLFVGVFMNQSVEYINFVSQYVGFDLIQLHSYNPLFDARLLIRPSIQVLPVSSVTTSSDLLQHFSSLVGKSYAVLLDTKKDESVGGTGSVFDWGIANAVAQDYPIILAGGLTPQNVHSAVFSVQPFIVDVASGVESDVHTTPPSKDRTKMRDFIFNAKKPLL